MSEKIQSICGKYFSKSNISHHRKRCIPCKLMKSMNLEHRLMKTKIKDQHCRIIQLSKLLKENKITFDDKDILRVLDDNMFNEKSVEDKIQNEDEKTDGYIYLLQIRESIRMNDDVYKVGKCENILNRFKQYPKGSKLLKYIQVPNRHISEGLLLKIMSDTYEVAKSYGNEYFHGDLNDILKTFEEFSKIGALSL